MTLSELAKDLGVTPIMLKEFAPDEIPADMPDDRIVPADTERVIRESVMKANSLPFPENRR